MRKNLWAGLLLLALAGCSGATGYQPFTNGQGYHETQTGPDSWSVVFVGIDPTTRETIQTYWLYRCAQLALEKGYDGFAPMRTVQFVMKGESAPRIQLAMAGHVSAAPTPIFVGGAGGAAPPRYISMAAEIRLIKAPVAQTPPVAFDAHKLIAQLDPIMAQPKCDQGNICAHDHAYLH